MGGLTWNYVLKRIGMWFLTIWLGTTIIFLIPRLAPGDPVAGIISRMTAQSGYIENAAQTYRSLARAIWPGSIHCPFNICAMSAIPCVLTWATRWPTFQAVWKIWYFRRCPGRWDSCWWRR